MGAVISKLLFQPPDPASYRDNGDIVWVPTKDGVKIPAVYLPCTGYEKPSSPRSSCTLKKKTTNKSKKKKKSSLIKT